VWKKILPFVNPGYSLADLSRLKMFPVSGCPSRRMRMALLYERDRFLSVPLEQQVYLQFSDFIRRKKRRLLYHQEANNCCRSGCQNGN